MVNIVTAYAETVKEHTEWDFATTAKAYSLLADFQWELNVTFGRDVNEEVAHDVWHSEGYQKKWIELIHSADYRRDWEFTRTYSNVPALNKSELCKGITWQAMQGYLLMSALESPLIKGRMHDLIDIKSTQTIYGCEISATLKFEFTEVKFVAREIK